MHMKNIALLFGTIATAINRPFTSDEIEIIKNVPEVDFIPMFIAQEISQLPPLDIDENTSDCMIGVLEKCVLRVYTHCSVKCGNPDFHPIECLRKCNEMAFDICERLDCWGVPS
ncbi:hypothetical protein CGMCC3_g13961 [Colletotrichum fructicola]|nr:uncharacterized protein CGMCC3_g13961 [Colletotrichum fructicola]KAE9569949.1 hypothetical protein CGMCC3_g13961 [Colletotrichum fructicola]